MRRREDWKKAGCGRQEKGERIQREKMKQKYNKELMQTVLRHDRNFIMHTNLLLTFILFESYRVTSIQHQT